MDHTDSFEGLVPILTELRRFGLNSCEFEISRKVAINLFFNTKDLSPYHTLVNYLLFHINFLDFCKYATFLNSSTTTIART